jgi:predicted RNA-binding Zn-ribbon protein involved in translation (DUF1610 family)
MSSPYRPQLFRQASSISVRSPPIQQYQGPESPRESTTTHSTFTGTESPVSYFSHQSSNSSPLVGSAVVKRCEVCQRSGLKTYTCIQCNNDLFCNDCWARERAHRPGAVGFDGKPHEKTDREVVERLRQILEPKRTTEEQEELHRNDEDTTWFGIARDSSGLPVFQDYERYATIMEQSRSAEGTVRYPQLVSFIGQTGKNICDKKSKVDN